MKTQNLQEIEQLLKPVPLAVLEKNLLVSVLIANYNYAHYIGEAIDSVLAQTYPHFELIVCDDGSTDNSCEVVEGYARRDSRIKLLRKENGGVADALNVAYRESKGQIVCLLDADDRYLPEKLKMVVRGFRCDPKGGFLGHRMFHIDSTGSRRGITPLIANIPSGWHGPNVVLYGDTPYGLAFGSGICLRREISQMVFPLPEALRIGADGAIFSLAPLMTPLIGLSAPLAEYRYHGRNVTNTPHVTLQSLDYELNLHRFYWQLQRDYLGRLHPRLDALLTEFDQRLGTMIRAYVHARLAAEGDTMRAYRNLVCAEGFQTLRPSTRWFWRFSLLLPRRIFRHALHPSWVKQLVWWGVKHVSRGISSQRVLFGR